jgi:hypothetical protein
VGSIFEDACAAASNAVDAVYGEPAGWDYIPMASDDPNGRPSPDPNRPRLTIVAGFFDPYARAFSNQARRQGVKPERTGHASSRPVLDIGLAQLPYDPRAKDRARRRQDGTFWEIAEVRPDGAGRAQLDLVLLSGAS